ncbi:MAG: adenylate/guanylate cyclase domain-containing protein [Pseudomonadota bacterium]
MDRTKARRTSERPQADAAGPFAVVFDPVFDPILGPAQAPPEPMRRYVRYWSVLYPLGAAVHLVALLVFLDAGAWLMVWVNGVSVPLYLACTWMLRRGVYRVPYGLAMAELAVHGALAVISVGPLPGLQSFVFPCVVLAFVQPFYPLRASLALAAAVAAFTSALMAVSILGEPLYDVPTWKLARNGAVTSFIFTAVVVAMVLPFILESRRAEAELEAAYDRSETLLLNILPVDAAERLKAGAERVVDEHDRVAVLFADLAGFTALSDGRPPGEVAALLDRVFAICDAAAERHGAEKIKTIGDAYMAVAGLPGGRGGPPEAAAAAMALEIRDAVAALPDPAGAPLRLRIGLNAGPASSGVIGRRKFAYDLWGDAVNVAARMEATGEPGRIQLPQDMADALAPAFRSAPRGEVEVKGKGPMRTAWLEGAS